MRDEYTMISKTDWRIDDVSKSVADRLRAGA